MQTNDWKRTTVGETFRVVGGGTPSTAKPEFWKGNIAWITSADIDSFHTVQPRRWITNEAIRNSATNLVPKGSIIVVTRVGLGKVAVAPEDLCFSQDSQALLPAKEKIDPKFAVLQLSQRVQSFKQISRGTTINGVTKKQLLDVELLLPPLDEQQRIVAEIEKQFTRLDAGVASLKRVQTALKRYRAGVLKAACEGRLVSTACKDWKQATLSNVLTTIEAGKSFRCDERPPLSHEVGVVKVSAVTWGTYNEQESKTCLDSKRLDTRFLIQPGDFLFSRANTIELIGACVIARKVTLPLMLSDKILRFRFVQYVEPEWVLYWLRSLFGRKEIERLATGNQMSMRNIGQERIRQIAIKLPPLDEQREIIAEVDRRLSVADELEATVTVNFRRAARLRRVILTDAFAGEL
jgi:type I restriction enzyme, S subunit